VLAFELVAGVPPFMHEDRMVMYRRIVDGVYTCPAHFSAVSTQALSLENEQIGVTSTAVAESGRYSASARCAASRLLLLRLQQLWGCHTQHPLASAIGPGAILSSL
jgi:hypothetical protein